MDTSPLVVMVTTPTNDRQFVALSLVVKVREKCAASPKPLQHCLDAVAHGFGAACGTCVRTLKAPWKPPHEGAASLPFAEAGRSPTNVTPNLSCTKPV